MVDILIANYKTSELDDNDHLAWFKQVMHVSNIRYTYIRDESLHLIF